MDYSFTKHAEKQLRGFPEEIQRFIIKKLKFYLSTPDPMHYADAIEGERGKVYRFRTGDYRLIFVWEKNRVLVTKVSIRPRAY